MPLEQTQFDTMPDGRAVNQFTLTNAATTSVQVIDFGATLTSVRTADRQGDLDEITLGFDQVAPYLDNPEYLGCVIGPFANRIGGAAFTLNGRRYDLEANEGDNNLHGGSVGFSLKLWQGEDVSDETGPAVAFSLRREDGEGNYPGNLQVTVTYRLNHDDTLELRYQAETDQATPVNLTNHAYWNLAGAGRRDVLDHELQIFADHALDMDAGLVPTGDFLDVADGPLDFATPRTLRSRFDEVSLPGDWKPGYDHAYALHPRETLESAAVIRDPGTGRVMEVDTTYPGMQLYTGNYLEVPNGAGGRRFEIYGGLALETQYFPDSVNKPDFPSTILAPGERYDHTTVYRFRVDR